MIVIADATPIHYLVLIHQPDILSALYGKVIIPEAVRRDLQAQKTPDPVKRWVASPPTWIEFRHVTVGEDQSFRGLDPGEREAIALAEALRADALIMDDRAGRREAERRGLRVIGTLRVLYDAAETGLLNLAEALEALQRSGFFIDRRLSKELLRRHAEKTARKRGGIL
jgi:predicted nucleic acid-binding protein